MCIPEWSKLHIESAPISLVLQPWVIAWGQLHIKAKMVLIRMLTRISQQQKPRPSPWGFLVLPSCGLLVCCMLPITNTQAYFNDKRGFQGPGLQIWFAEYFYIVRLLVWHWSWCKDQKREGTEGRERRGEGRGKEGKGEKGGLLISIYKKEGCT